MHENFFVDLSNPVNATLFDAQGEATIGDDDAAGGLGPGLQRAVGAKTAGAGLSFEGSGVQIKVIPYLARARQDRSILATIVMSPCT